MTEAGLRVLTYNVRSLRDDARAVARVIRECDPDVACIQEAPRFLGWRRRTQWLAQASGLVVVTGGRPAGAMLLLARPTLRVLRSYDVLLTKRPRLHQRGLAVGVFGVGGCRVAVASMHLDLAPPERLRHVDEIFGVVDRLEADELVLAGDVNESPGAPAWQRLTRRLSDAGLVAPSGGELTFPARSPRRRIDGVFVSSGVRVLGCGVPALPGLARASDHCPVVADLSVAFG